MDDRINTDAGLRRITQIVAAIIALTVFITIPAGFFLIVHGYVTEELDSEASLGADVVSEIIYANPGLWNFNEHRLVGALRRVQLRQHTHHIVVADAHGKTVAILQADQEWPVLSASVDLMEGDEVVGTITVSESVRPLLIDTIFATVVSAFLALSIYFALKILPLQALTRVVRDLDESRKLLREEIQTKEQALLEAKEMGTALRYQALHDGLTNLPNRTLLHDRLQQAILIARREKNSLALVMLDLDQFKTINDTLGHHAGDIVLQQISIRLMQTLRSSDTVARLGGDEFAILLPVVTGQDGVVVTAQKVIDIIKQPIIIESQALYIGASLGAVIFPEHGDDPAALLRCADVAMYCAKRAQTGFELYDVKADLLNVKHITLQNELRTALAENQLILHYQPKVDLVTNRICSVEALVRWQHPTEGLILPDGFVPIAERNGLIKALTQNVLKMALQQLTKWQRVGLELPVAINISGVNLQDPAFSDQVMEIMRGFPVPPALLEMEITETALMEDPLSAIEMIQKLRNIGITISIDDFGTGYSSMAYLKKLVVTKIKIDKSFVMDMVENASDMIIVRSTIELAHNLGMTVIAEGVETEEAMNQLKKLGCDMAQGYHMSHPLPVDKLSEWLDKSDWGIDKSKS